MEQKTFQLIEPWSSLSTPIREAARHFWAHAPYQNYGRQQNMSIWPLLQASIADLLRTQFSPVPITPFEQFLLTVVSFYYECGWQVPGAPELPIKQRYFLSGGLIRDSFQRKAAVPNLGLTDIDPTAVEVIATICSAYNLEDLSTLSLDPVPGGYQETVRLRYLVALLQIADLLQVRRQKDAYFRNLGIIRQEEDSRLALARYVTLFELKFDGLCPSVRLHRDDYWLVKPIVDCIMAPLYRWWIANWQWLAQELQIAFMLWPASVAQESRGLSQPPLQQTCPALIQYLASYQPPDIAGPTLEQVKAAASTLNQPLVEPESNYQGGKVMPEQYIDFYVHINSQGHAVCRSNEGEASETIQPDIRASIESAVSSAELNIEHLKLYQQLGQELYELVFPGAIHTHLQRTEASARVRAQKVRIRLDIEMQSIAVLPLEFLYRKDRGHFLAVDPNIALSRYLPVQYPRNSVRRREGPLHMLTIIAAPGDQYPLNVTEWKTLIMDALQEPVANQLLTLDFANGGTIREINTALLKKKPDIVQFVGHGIYHENKAYLALVSERGTTRLIDDASFANLFLGSLDTLGLLCLAGCESATSTNPSSFLGLAPQLIQRGFPAVIAMQYSVKVSTAKLFFNILYQNVANHKPVDWAVQQGRNMVAIEKGSNNREFATPVLYMRAEDGAIF